MWNYFRKKEGRWYIKWREKGSRKVYGKRRAIYNWEQTNGKLQKGYEIHHINLDKTDDRIENLQCLSRSEHRRLHAELIKDHRIIDGIEFRRCQCCEEYKEIIDFYKNNRKHSGYGGYCKECSRIKLQQWREANKEHHNEYHREYRAKHK